MPTRLVGSLVKGLMCLGLQIKLPASFSFSLRECGNTEAGSRIWWTPEHLLPRCSGEATGAENEQGTGLAGSWLCDLPPGGWRGSIGNPLNPLNFSFLICKMGIGSTSCNDNIKGHLTRNQHYKWLLFMFDEGSDLISCPRFLHWCAHCFHWICKFW